MNQFRFLQPKMFTKNIKTRRKFVIKVTVEAKVEVEVEVAVRNQAAAVVENKVRNLDIIASERDLIAKMKSPGRENITEKGAHPS